MKKFIVLVCAMLATAALSAAEKTGYINMETVFNEYYKTINENITFENNRKAFVDGMDVLRTEYQASAKEFQKCKADAENELLTTDARSAAASRAKLLQGRLEQKQDEIMEYRENGLREIESKQQNVTNALADELATLVRKYAADNGYTLVFEVSGRTFSRVPAVLVYPKGSEITDAVIKVINAGHEKERTDGKAKLEALRKQAEEEAKAAAAAATAAAK